AALGRPADDRPGGVGRREAAAVRLLRRLSGASPASPAADRRAPPLAPTVGPELRGVPGRHRLGQRRRAVGPGHVRRAGGGGDARPLHPADLERAGPGPLTARPGTRSLARAGALAVAFVAGSTVALLGRPPGRRGWVGAAVVAVLLGLPHPYLTIFVLQGPHHVATAVVCLVAFGLLAGAGPGSGRWVAGTGLLAVAAHSDP